ncbi:MEKHLA domain-containing protein [Streptomyces sp. NPDC089424]|uniref:MEKHLA domain-containing protein n=1 Tax=Streptomyces sp. NPDC089424 TaxID=3365917 RepID=UPI0038204FC3
MNEAHRRTPRPPDPRRDPEFAALLRDSHRRLVGADPWPSLRASSDAEAARWLYEDAPFGLLAHDTAADPVFVYANRTALRCFAYDWDAFVGLPSRLSAEPAAQEDREALLHQVAVHHYVTGYQGVRISRSGRRFRIRDVTMWDLVDADGTLRGQAALFRSWSDA